MRSVPFLFDRLQADLGHRLRSDLTVPAVAGWAAAEPALADTRTALDAAGRCRDRQAPGGGRPALAALVRLAGEDRLAAEAAMWGLLPALRSVAARLSRSWGADPDDIDQEVATAGWARLMAVAGQSLPWPDRTIAEGARVTVRDGLRARSRTEQRLAVLPDPATIRGQRDGAVETVEAVNVLGSAVRRGTVSARAAGLVWATRVDGATPAEAGGRVGCSAKAATMACLRAERILRADLAAAA